MPLFYQSIELNIMSSNGTNAPVKVSPSSVCSRNKKIISRMVVSKSIFIILLSSAHSIWNIHRRVFVFKKRNINHGENSRWLEGWAECSACLRSVINHHQQPHKMRRITNGWLEDTSWLLPLGATVNALPHCSGGNTKGGCSPAVKKPADLYSALPLKLNSSGFYTV